MCDDWMPRLDVSLSFEQFEKLPRNPAYKYEYFNGMAHLSPRPRFYHALLDLQSNLPDDDPSARALGRLELRCVRTDDFTPLVALFAAAFERQQPFGSLCDEQRLEAARVALTRTRDGGDGPWLEPASFVAKQDGRLVGALLVTLLPDGDHDDPRSFRWHEAPPADVLERRGGRPHLTWIFVAPYFVTEGVGSALLEATRTELRSLGYDHLLSTFLLGNDSSTLWHWRMGFRLLAYPWSYRRLPRKNVGRSE